MGFYFHFCPSFPFLFLFPLFPSSSIPLPSLPSPASHLHCILLPSSPPYNQLSVHIHLPTPIRCGIGNDHTNTL